MLLQGVRTLIEKRVADLFLRVGKVQGHKKTLYTTLCTTLLHKYNIVEQRFIYDPGTVLVSGRSSSVLVFKLLSFRMHIYTTCVACVGVPHFLAYLSGYIAIYLAI